MDPLSALSLASNIIQIVDFSSRIVSRGYELYNSADGRTEEHAMLDNAAENLSRLYEDLNSCLKSNSRKLTQADQQLLELSARSKVVVDELRQALDKAKVMADDRKWQSVYQALRTIRTDKQISTLAGQLGEIRKQVDTAILISLRYVQKVSFKTRH